MKALIIIGIILFTIFTALSFILKLIDSKNQISTVILGMIVIALSVLLYMGDF